MTVGTSSAQWGSPRSNSASRDYRGPERAGSGAAMRGERHLAALAEPRAAFRMHGRRPSSAPSPFGI